MGTNHPTSFGKWKFERDRDAPYYNEQIKKKKKRLKEIAEKLKKWEKRTSGLARNRTFMRFSKRYGKRSKGPLGKSKRKRVDYDSALRLWNDTYKKLIDHRYFERSFLVLDRWKPKSRRRMWARDRGHLRLCLRDIGTDWMTDDELADMHEKDFWWFDRDDIKQEFLLAMWEEALVSKNHINLLNTTFKMRVRTWSIRKQGKACREIRQLLEAYPDCGYETFDGVKYVESRSFWRYRARHAYDEGESLSTYLSSLGLLPRDYSACTLTWLHFPQLFLKKKAMGYEKHQEQWETPLLCLIKDGILNQRLEGDKDGFGTELEAQPNQGHGSGSKDAPT